jgi:hypothetical protein
MFGILLSVVHCKISFDGFTLTLYGRFANRPYPSREREKGDGS